LQKKKKQQKEWGIEFDRKKSEEDDEICKNIKNDPKK
jgi:hypothetical protein